MHNPENHTTPETPWTAATNPAVALPSLGHAEIFSGPIDLTPAASHTVNFAAMPPMFERRRRTPPKELPKTKSVVATIPADAAPPIQPAKPPASCESPALPSKVSTKQAAALADDRATLNALRQAVQDLQLEKDLDFMMPQNTNAAQSTPAVMPNATPEPTAP